MDLSSKLDGRGALGLIGVRSIGRCMPTSLIEVGYRVAAFDPSPRQNFIIEHGGILCADPAEVVPTLKGS